MLCVLQKVFYEIENWVKCRELEYGFADLVCGSGVWVSGFRNCVTSKDSVFKQLEKKRYVVNIKKIQSSESLS